MTAPDLAALQQPSHMGKGGRKKRLLALFQHKHSLESLAHSSLPKHWFPVKAEKMGVGREEERRLD